MISAIILTLYTGFLHAFESDHLLAVSNMVTNRNKIQLAIKDGMFWGLGHTSTILIIGVVFLLLKFNLNQQIFNYFESGVGLMLVFLGFSRIRKWNLNRTTINNAPIHTHIDGTIHSHDVIVENSHLPAYIIGLIHGLAGSGALMIIVLSKSNSTTYGLLYLALFGLGSVCGMMLATSVFSMPFSKNIFRRNGFQTFLVFTSAILCIVYGFVIMKENLF